MAVMSEKLLLNSADIDRIINDFAAKIYDDLSDKDNFALVGVQTRGVELARRLQNRIEAISGKPVKNGVLDITFYRDDLATRGMLPSIKETKIEFDIARMTIVLVDDVIYTGRTTKAALETITAFGRPGVIRLFTLIDRGNRELPIQPDYCGHKINVRPGNTVRVMLREIDGVEDSVVLLEQ
jgi:pyrimidine operon attenuation protein/uracil phosphoribosyltransferase